MALPDYRWPLPNVERAELHVPAPGQDGWRYHVPTVDLLEAPPWEADQSPVLGWRVDDRDGPYVTPSGRILDEFVRLPLRSDDDFPHAVLAFARKYGVLGICHHGKPAGHPPGCIARNSMHGWQGFLFYEPISAWRRYANQLRGVLGVAFRLQSNFPGYDDDWDAIVGANLPPIPRPAPLGEESPAIDDYLEYERVRHDVDVSREDFIDGRTFFDGGVAQQKMAIGDAARVWVGYGDVKLDAFWLPGETYIQSRFTVSNLSAALAVSLLAALQGDLYVCAWCKTASRLGEDRKRRPRAGTKFWCTVCGRKAQKSAADRRRYLRRTGEVDRGAPLAE